MRVLISGSSGFIGNALVDRLEGLGHVPVRLVRADPPDRRAAVRWDPTAGQIAPDALDGVDAVVHLAGESIATSRWTSAQKARILDSRVAGTSTLAGAVAAACHLAWARLSHEPSTAPGGWLATRPKAPTSRPWSTCSQGPRRGISTPAERPRSTQKASPVAS